VLAVAVLSALIVQSASAQTTIEGAATAGSPVVSPLPPATPGSTAIATPTVPLPELAPQPSEKPIGAELDTLASTPLGTPRPTFPQSITLKIASWNISGASQATTSTPTANATNETATTWRTTFGSERSSASWRKRGPAGFEADVIAMQGVTNLQDIRRSFGARRFHLIASRQLLTQNTATSLGISVERSTAPPTTAVAYRRQRGTRIAGVRHFLPDRSAHSEPPAITAFRLRLYRKMIWFASLDLPADCPKDMATAACEPHRPTLARFLTWTRRIARQQTPLILLGHWPAHLTDQLKDAGFETSPRHSQETAGCTEAPISMLMAQPANSTGTQRLSEFKTPDAGKCLAITEVTVALR